MWKTLGFDLCLWVLVHCSCLTDHLMVDLKTIIALATILVNQMFMSYIREMKKFSTTLPMKTKIFCYTYYKG